MLQVPQWSVQAMVELVVPLAITVLVVQNGQGVAVLRAAGHDAPVNVITIACGVWSLLARRRGGRVDLPDRPDQRAARPPRESARATTRRASCCGLLAMVFGLLAPLFTRLMLATPSAFVAVLAGLAMLRVLQAAFVTAFGGRFTLGALVTFIVTVADLTIFNIGAAFWGLVAGIVVSLLLERADFAENPRPAP